MRHGGFTLIETLIATAVLVWGLVAVAHLFFYSARMSVESQRRAAAMLLAYDKIEALRAAGGALPAEGGRLDPGNRAPGYWDRAAAAPGPPAAYLRLWQVAGGPEWKITVIVYGPRPGTSAGWVELTRLSARPWPRF